MPGTSTHSITAVALDSGQVRLKGQAIEIDLDPAAARALADQLLYESVPRAVIDGLSDVLDLFDGADKEDQLRRWLVDLGLSGQRPIDRAASPEGIDQLRIEILRAANDTYA